MAEKAGGGQGNKVEEHQVRPMIKAIFWDNDGVLVETEGIFFRANQETLADLGISLGWEQFEEISLVRGGSVLQLAQKPGTEAFYKLRS